MTVILDPGTTFSPLDPFSYDATPKIWRLTAGQWKAAGTATSGDLSAMTSLRDAAVATIAARDATIVTRDATIVTRDATIVTRDNTITSLGTQLTNATAPASIQAWDTNLSNITGLARNTWQQAAGSWTPTINGAGSYALYATCQCNSESQAASIDYAQIRIKVAGNVVATGDAGHRTAVDTDSKHEVFGTSTVTHLQAVTVEVLHSADEGSNLCTFGSIILKARFIPTSSVPH